MKENILFGDDARKAIMDGVSILNKAVSPTIGPKGRTILMENKGLYPSLTKDGVSVAKKVKLKDKFKRQGCDVVKEASEKTCSIVGDGTSSTILLSHAILTQGMKLLNSGFSSTELKKGITKATEEVVKNLKSMAKDVKNEDEIKQIATISANNDKEIGDLLSKALKHSGEDGIVMIDKSNSFNNSLEVIEGMELGRGFVSPYFITNENKQTCEFEDAFIFISTKRLKNHEELVPLLEKVLKTKKPILFIGEEVEGQFLHTLITNKLNGNINACAIISPGIGEYKYHLLEDVATLTGGELITDASGHSLSKLNLSSLGRCKKLIIGKFCTTIVGGSGDKEKIEKRIDEVKTQLINPTLNEQDKRVLQSRLAKLTGKIAVVKVGGNTEAEMNEKFDRVEDALCACKAAVKEGIVPGGGVALLRAASDLKIDSSIDRGIQAGMEALKTSCFSLMRKIVENTGDMSPDVVINKVLSMKKAEGLNALTGEYCDLIENGIIDPVLATRTALENASSVASLLLDVDSLIVEDDETQEQNQNQMNNPYMSATAF